MTSDGILEEWYMDYQNNIFKKSSNGDRQVDYSCGFYYMITSEGDIIYHNIAEHKALNYVNSTGRWSYFDINT
jgi:hypothetical protein